MSSRGIGDHERHQSQYSVYTHYRLRSLSLCPDTGGLYDYRQDEEDGAKGGAFGSSMESGVHVGKAVETKSSDQIEEKANTYEYITYYVQRSH
jgi:hypothetical protein